ncbi:GIY-YIG nuclease family protein [Butyrivibrio sp. WCE2006]|uniref:GIY-YIG nuclease family protein n=1 Tax=Butyrivibrio sp. WCE2006 TaxID=1410611 RepID=UPI0005D1A591|nr:GIY-YIG nuclease family protein [Butyrivibrio sp. WCE2006]
MAKGIIYVMTTAVPGLVKIGKTGSEQFEQRMYNLEHNGYRNVTALKRSFAIEVEDYDEKESLLHTIFEKSRLADTELFAIDVNIVIQLLSSFDGNMIYPIAEKKDEVFEEAANNSQSKLIPNGIYTLKRKKKIENNRTISATAEIKNGSWMLKKGSKLGMVESAGVSKKAKIIRANMALDKDGQLLEDYDFGECAPSLVGDVVMFASVDGWTEWKNIEGKPVDIYRVKEKED